MGLEWPIWPYSRNPIATGRAAIECNGPKARFTKLLLYCSTGPSAVATLNSSQMSLMKGTRPPKSSRDYFLDFVTNCCFAAIS